MSSPNQPANPRIPVSIMSRGGDSERRPLVNVASDSELSPRKERGSKTPRRVQWSDGVHSLDEYGLDVSYYIFSYLYVFIDSLIF
jgi:hypothetical protein